MRTLYIHHIMKYRSTSRWKWKWKNSFKLFAMQKKHQPNVSCFVRIRKCQPLTVILITRTPDAYITFVVFIVISNN